MSLKNKLNRLKSHISNKNDGTEKVIAKPTMEIPFLDRWKEDGVTPFFLDNQYCLIRKKRYPFEFRHGIYQLGEFSKAVELWNKANLTHPLSTKGYTPDQLFFFDTETTGLGGGVGNSIFILGHASFTENEVILTQHILPHPGAEIPLYHSFLSDVDYETLVTYNGKSFDWPQVKTRHTLIRDHVPKLPEFGHFDLFHAARRMWKHRLDRLKLSIVEEEVLGVKRVDDIPGHLAPMIYFDFVERKDPEGMIKILAHNEWDILSLITLYTHLSYQLLGTDQSQTVYEKFEVGRWLSSLGEISSAKKVYKGIENEEVLISIHSQLNLGYLYKKQKKYDQSLEYFQKVVKYGISDIYLEACVEAAKILEHRQKEYMKAVYYCDLALAFIQAGCKTIKISIPDILKRKERNVRKYIPHGKNENE